METTILSAWEVLKANGFRLPRFSPHLDTRNTLLFDEHLSPSSMSTPIKEEDQTVPEDNSTQNAVDTLNAALGDLSLANQDPESRSVDLEPKEEECTGFNQRAVRSSPTTYVDGLSEALADLSIDVQGPITQVSGQRSSHDSPEPEDSLLSIWNEEAGESNLDVTAGPASRPVGLSSQFSALSALYQRVCEGLPDDYDGRSAALAADRQRFGGQVAEAAMSAFSALGAGGIMAGLSRFSGGGIGSPCKFCSGTVEQAFCLEHPYQHLKFDCQESMLQAWEELSAQFASQEASLKRSIAQLDTVSVSSNDYSRLELLEAQLHQVRTTKDDVLEDFADFKVFLRHAPKRKPGRGPATTVTAPLTPSVSRSG